MAGIPVWYELMTPDPAAVAPFYRATLGWDIPAAGQVMPNGSDYRAIIRADGGNAGGVLTLTAGMAAGGAKPGWLTYFQVDDVDASVEQAAASGSVVLIPATTMPGAGRMAMLADPQGAPFYVMDPAPPPDQPDAHSEVFKGDAPGHCTWNELNSDDAEGQIAFYTGLFPWTVEGEMPMPGDHVYKFLTCEGRGIGAIGSMKPPGMGNAWLPYFRVANIETATAAVTANGGTIVMGPHEVPGGDVIIVALDPAGGAVGLVGAKG
jgi:predicted enzyme related to lactoylglutathione lyase